MAKQKLSGREVIKHLREIMHIPDGVRAITVRARYDDVAVCECEYMPYRHDGIECSDETAGGMFKGGES